MYWLHTRNKRKMRLANRACKAFCLTPHCLKMNGICPEARWLTANQLCDSRRSSFNLQLHASWSALVICLTSVDQHCPQSVCPKLLTLLLCLLQSRYFTSCLWKLAVRTWGRGSFAELAMRHDFNATELQGI